MLNKTERLFESNPASKEFDANVVELRALAEGQGVVLNRTLFYPEGGGQVGKAEDARRTIDGE